MRGFTSWYEYHKAVVQGSHSVWGLFDDVGLIGWAYSGNSRGVAGSKT